MGKKISPRESISDDHLEYRSKRQKSNDDSLAKKKLSDFGFQTHFYRPPEPMKDVEEEIDIAYEKAKAEYGRIAKMHRETFI